MFTTNDFERKLTSPIFFGFLLRQRKLYFNDKNKLILLINSYHHDKNVVVDVERKPKVIDIHNKTKIGVDSLICLYDTCM